MLSNFIRENPKDRVDKVIIEITDRNGEIIARVPIDRDAKYVYYSVPSKYIHPEEAVDSVLTHAIHYGNSAFEGMRFYRTPKGVAMVEPWMNYARLINSAHRLTSLKEEIAYKAKDETSKKEELVAIRYSARELFELSRRMYFGEIEQKIKYWVIENENRQIVKPIYTDFTLPCIFGGEENGLSLNEMDAIIKSLAFLNGLVSEKDIVDGLNPIPSGYIRPLWWMSGEEGLKLSSIIRKTDANGSEILRIKPGYFMATTLPWGLYLKEEHYERGLDVVVTPIPRINYSMPGDAKCGANYVNSTLAVTFPQLEGYGEILFKNEEGKIVEGSAETLFIVKKYRNKRIAYTPPTSDNILPGTTRDRIVRVLNRMGIEVEYESLELEEITRPETEAVFFVGTGAQIIHIRSITDTPEVYRKLQDAVRIRGENDNRKEIRITKKDMDKSLRKKFVIGNGNRPEIVRQINEEYVRMVLESGLEPVYRINPEHLASALELDVREFATKEMIDEFRSGRYLEETTNREEILNRTINTAKMIEAAIKARKRRDPTSSDEEIREMVRTLARNRGIEGRLKINKI